ncbi:sugar transferase [Lachnoanaerobaculum saburreum]|uniref:Bacterial sugar transferase n=1 Tax=Lachnoanaerobaculum saburreum DSM 3986 TaxID=887325 RepID=E6LPY9_9FIRM|nr:sugar transferase [Lachnoanaerobaculum saburreum]EFU76057.1 bacterial sugar transferase [Lachnoanaerobaculum saburreum DSM 3986]
MLRINKNGMITKILVKVLIITDKIISTNKKKNTCRVKYSNLQYRRISFYEKYIKRIFDIICSVLAIIVFWWLYVIIAILVRIKLGSPILFTQYRPGIIDQRTGKEKIFKLYKFRTMIDKRDSNGELLPDNLRMTKFGAWLRSTSLDELPEVISILKGDMSVIGPRPQLVRDMVFMSNKQRMRHTVKPGLSGLAQIMGRNAISWDKKLKYDLHYLKHISFKNDLYILLNTVIKAFLKKEGITEEGKVTSSDYGDYLLSNNQISREEYDKMHRKAERILEKIV